MIAVLSAWRAELANSALVLSGVLVGLLGCLLWTLIGADRWRRWVPGPRIAAWLTIGFAAAWVVVDKQAEGPTLLVVSDGHGVTASDLVSVVAVVIAGWRLMSPSRWAAE